MSGGTFGNSSNTSVRDRARRAESDAQGEETVVRPSNAHQRLAAFKAESVPTATTIGAGEAMMNAWAAEAEAQRKADIASGKLIVIKEIY
jgi:hypothetical protein